MATYGYCGKVDLKGKISGDGGDGPRPPALPLPLRWRQRGRRPRRAPVTPRCCRCCCTVATRRPGLETARLIKTFLRRGHGRHMAHVGEHVVAAAAPAPPPPDRRTTLSLRQGGERGFTSNRYSIRLPNARKLIQYNSGRGQTTRERRDCATAAGGTREGGGGGAGDVATRAHRSVGRRVQHENN